MTASNAASTGPFTGESQVFSNGRQAGAVDRIAEGKLDLHLRRVFPTAMEQRVRAVLPRHEQLKSPTGHRRQHAKDIKQIRLARTVRPDEHIQRTEFEPLKLGD